MIKNVKQFKNQRPNNEQYKVLLIYLIYQYNYQYINYNINVSATRSLPQYK